MLNLLMRLPSVAELGACGSAAALIAALDEAHPCAYGALRCVCVRACVCVCACVRACARARVPANVKRACVRV